jgi:hypothetical protein
MDNKISSRAALHRINPNTFLTPLCKDCNGNEDQDHMLVTCYLKSAVWQTILAENTTKTIWSDSSILSLLTPNPVHAQMQESCPLSIRQLVAATILGIWGHHWTQHFDDVAFDHVAATNNARSHIQRLCKQIQYRNKADFKTHDLIS